MDTAQLKVETICSKNGLALSAQQRTQLSTYVELLLDWNSKINLISRADVQNVWFNHILHSLSLFFFLDFPEAAKLMDLGTGGGLPGIPISIVRPDVRITLLDSIRKKTMVVQDIVDKLSLSSVSVITGRAEDIARQAGLKNSFDILVSRAVAPLADLIQWSRPLLRMSRGQHKGIISDTKVLNCPSLVTLKGGELSSEIEAARIKSGLKNYNVVNLTFDGCEELGLQDKKLVIVTF